MTDVQIWQMHNIVESALEAVRPEVAKSYRDYRNYKQDFVGMLDSVYKKSQSIMYIGDRENSNTDSALVSTKRSLIFNQLNKELYQKFFMNTEELQACRDGYIYIHDMSARRDTMNCCLFDVKHVLKDGFEMGNLWYSQAETPMSRSMSSAISCFRRQVSSTAALLCRALICCSSRMPKPRNYKMLMSKNTIAPLGMIGGQSKKPSWRIS